MTKIVTEEVERVARALMAHAGDNEECSNGFGGYMTWHDYAGEATAAIEAMRASSAGGDVVERAEAMLEAELASAGWSSQAASQSKNGPFAKRDRAAVRAIANALQSQPPSNEARLREALEKCRAKFTEYARQHQRKADAATYPPERDERMAKADANLDMAIICDAALSNEGNG